VRRFIPEHLAATLNRSSKTISEIMSTSDICLYVGELRKEIKQFVDGDNVLSKSEIKQKLQELKHCEILFKEASLNASETSKRNGLDGIKNAYIVSLHELENKGIFQHSSRVEQTQKPGRPEKAVDIEKVKLLARTGMKLVNIAKLEKVSYSKIYALFKKHTGKSPREMIHSNISEDELDDRLTKFEAEHGRHGRRLTEGFLRSQDILLPNAKKQIKQSNDRRQLDPLPIGNRLHRREYKVRGPGSVFHIDSHHKLGRRYGIVIHGCVDGFSKLCVYLRASTRNNSEIAFKFFKWGCSRVILPSRVRTDKGTENVLIWKYMIEQRGASHKPVLKGPSTNNTRIERFWVYLTQGFVVKKYKNLFQDMEEEGVLNLDSDNELVLLQLVFLPRIDNELKEFSETYNKHRIDSHGIPMEVFIRGCYDVFGIESPRLKQDFNVAQVDVQGEDVSDDDGDMDDDLGDTRSEEQEPLVRDASLSCSEYQKHRLFEKLRQTFGDIEFYSDTNFFASLSNVEAKGAFIHSKNILNDVLLDL